MLTFIIEAIYIFLGGFNVYRKIEKKAPTKSEERLIRVCRSLPVGSPRLRGRPGIFLCF